MDSDRCSSCKMINGDHRWQCPENPNACKSCLYPGLNHRFRCDYRNNFKDIKDIKDTEDTEDTEDTDVFSPYN